MPPSRKSCLACAQSKRRCDKGLPKCGRCLAKNTDCEYNGRNPGLRKTTGRSVEVSIAVAEPFAEDLASDWQLQRSPAVPAAAILSPCTSDPFFNFSNDPFDLESIPQNGFLSETFMEDTIAQQNPNDIGRITSSTTAQARVEFAAKKLAALPKTFSQQGQTMFIHRRLFQDRTPPALQDALSTCALYCLKNTENQALVFRNLEHKRQQLIAKIEPLLAPKMDLLEALQALIMYQIISLFDGDIRLRAQAEADELVLLIAAPLAPIEAQCMPGSTSPSWRRWLIEESSRRTVITAFMLKGVYSYLKLGHDTVPDLQMGFTAQAALWNSQSETSWQRAQGEREWLEVRVTHWDEAIAKAKPDDLEELGVLIMVMLKGTAATGKWLGYTHNIRYGLEGSEHG
ncbi:hypothetical protein N7491_001372 [Penicillium cf. griseofulvum]|nr:hypothetical protein N7491_001372 [Penicillium cf. griseofulvum]